MPVIRMKGFQIFKDRHGKTRCYHRASGLPINLEKTPIGTAEFFAECERIKERSIRKVPMPGALGLLIQNYCASKNFQDLAPRTRADYEAIFDYLKPIAETALQHFDPPLVARIRDKAAEMKGRRFGTYVRQVLSIIFGWGVERGYMKTNPAKEVKGIKRPRGLERANHPWTDEERHVVLEAASPALRAIIALMMYTGMGPKDVVAVQKIDYADSEITTSRSKTGEPIFWPVPAQLKDELKRGRIYEIGRRRKYAEKNNGVTELEPSTLCVNSFGWSWSQDGMQASWQKLKGRLVKAGLVRKSLTLYGLRHTLAVILREIGEDERTIADALAQRDIKSARIYATGADLRPKMLIVSKSFEKELTKRATKARTKLSNLSEKVSNLKSLKVG